jgi:hypothetical protein
MLRTTALAVGALIGFGSIPPIVLATTTQEILAAGSDMVGVIDANNNGTLNEDDDCVVHARVNPNGSSLDVFGRQDPSAPDRMLLCTNPNDLADNEGHCSGDGSVSSDSAEATLDGCQFSAGPFVPMRADFCSSLTSCLAKSAPLRVRGQAAASSPPRLTAGVVFQTLFTTPVRSGSGQICSAGGPAVEITGDDGVKVLFAIVPFPDAQNPTHMCVHNVPVQLTAGGKVLRTVCFPVRNGMTDFALGSTPDDPFAIIAFDSLPPCGPRAEAPSMSEWGLIVLTLGLLAVGTWVRGRRGTFYESLPLP